MIAIQNENTEVNIKMNDKKWNKNKVASSRSQFFYHARQTEKKKTQKEEEKKNKD